MRLRANCSIPWGRRSYAAWLGAFLLLSACPASTKPGDTGRTLAPDNRMCEEDARCEALWGIARPFCAPTGFCSECLTEEDCAKGEICEGSPFILVCFKNPYVKP